MKRILQLIICCTLLTAPAVIASGNDYSDHSQMSIRLRALADAHQGLVSLESLATTAGGKEIWLLSIGSGNLSERPAVALVGGISGDHLLGSELAVQFAEQLLARAGDESVRQLMDSVTFYVFPDMSPDARAQYFAPLRYERLGNANPADLDRDGRIGEDPYNDLNGDGLITMMRISDPAGRWMKHPEDERIMVRANPEKGERGSYILLSEGVDMDRDGQWNEDGEEGVIFNKNFSFNYPVFSRGAGENAISEHESRAIADFLFAARNVFAVISFGPANNLSHPLTYNEKNASGRILNGWLEQDVAVNRMVSHSYQQHVDVSGASAVAGQGGDFFQWAYFHYGRFSFSTPGWWIPSEKESGSSELDFMRWTEQQQIPDVFIPWTRVEHPDFPGQEVEVGGFAPFVMKNPPYAMVEELAERHYHFIMDIAAMRPVIGIGNVKTESLGRNLYRITADIFNQGSLPATSALGQRVRWVQKPVIRLQASGSQQLLSGKSVEVLEELPAHSSLRRSWLVQGKGRLNLVAGGEASGFQEIEIIL